jgi:hypothetical protein
LPTSPRALPAFLTPSLAVSVALAIGLLLEFERELELELRRPDAREADERDGARLVAVERDPLLRLLVVRELAGAERELPLDERVELELGRLAELEFDRRLRFVDELLVCGAM